MNVMHRRDLDGCPNYVRAWCCKAADNTMHRGFRDVGYLLAPHVVTFQPPSRTQSLWRRAVWELHDLCRAGNEPGVLRWCLDAYPSLMSLVPKPAHGDFAAGLVERLGKH